MCVNFICSHNRPIYVITFDKKTITYVLKYQTAAMAASRNTKRVEMTRAVGTTRKSNRGGKPAKLIYINLWL